MKPYALKQTEEFRAMLAHHMEGHITAGEFKSFLRSFGIQPCGDQDEYQLRLQIPHGRLSMTQFRALGALATDSVAKAPLHLGSRQEIHLNLLRFWELSALVSRLEDLGLDCRKFADLPINGRPLAECAAPGPESPIPSFGEREDGYESWQQAQVRYQERLGSYCAVIELPFGNLGPRQVEAIALFMEGAGLLEIRLDDEGRLLLPKIPSRLLPVLYSGLKRLDLVGKSACTERTTTLQLQSNGKYH